MTIKELQELKFVFETLPSGRINLKHNKCFSINGLMSTSVGRGQWLHTFEVKSINDVAAYIETLRFINFV